MSQETKPNPGTPEAIAAGCSCPVIDNGHGAGYRGCPGIFVYNGSCELHEEECDLDITDYNTMMDDWAELDRELDAEEAGVGDAL